MSRRGAMGACLLHNYSEEIKQRAVRFVFERCQSVRILVSVPGMTSGVPNLGSWGAPGRMS